MSKATTITKGMANAMSKNGSKLTCPDCGLAVPSYTGRYPSACPDCGAALVPVVESRAKTILDKVQHEAS